MGGWNGLDFGIMTHDDARVRERARKEFFSLFFLGGGGT